jgi:subtilase family serine protease
MSEEGKNMRYARSCIAVLLVVLMIGSSAAMGLAGAFAGAHARGTGADITVVSVFRMAPSTPKVGNNVSFNATIKNVGDVNATNVTITITAMNDTLGAPINLGTFHTGHDNGQPNLTGKPSSPPLYFWFYWNTSKTGLEVTAGLAYTVTVTASNKTDANASNNSATCKFNFFPADKKDPHVVDITAAPASVIVGQNVTINGTFNNNGSLQAPAEPVFFYLDYKWGQANKDIFNTTVDLPGMFDIGDPVSVEFQWNTTGATIGNHTVTAIVPSTGSNITTGNITVKPVPPPPGKPDLTILELGVNRTSILQGLPLNLSVTIKNVGNNASIATKVNITDTMTAYTSEFGIPAMTAGQEKVFYQTINTSKLTVAFHNLQVWADRPNINDEWNETNNTKYVKFSVISKPDLVLSEMKFYENSSWSEITTAPQGNFIKITVDVKNMGHNSSKNGTQLLFYLDNTNTPINSLLPYGPGAGQTSCSAKNGTISLLPYAPGSDYNPLCIWNTSAVSVGIHKIIAIVDVTDINDELNESNNMVSANFTLTEVIMPPDLAINSLLLTKTSVSPGDKVRIDLVVENKGQGVAENIDLNAALETTTGVELAAINHTVLPILNPAKPLSLSLVWNFSENLAVGNYMVSVVLDKNHRIHETNENNNENTTPVKVVDRVPVVSNPTITSIETPEKMTQDKKFTVTVNLVNKGNKDSRDLVLNVFVDGTKVGTQTLSVLGKNGTTTKMEFNVTIKDKGKHWINATLIEGGVIKYTTTHPVDIKAAQTSGFTSTNTILLILALLLLVAIAVVLMAAGKKKPSEYEDEDEEGAEDEEAPVKAAGEEE